MTQTKTRIRSQLDNFDADSLAAGIEFDPAENMTRQEFKDESDINFLLNRYGALPPQRSPEYGDIDFTMDLLSAHEAVREAERLFSHLTPAIREKLGSWQVLAQMVANEDPRLLDLFPKPPAAGDGNASPPSPDGGAPAGATPTT